MKAVRPHTMTKVFQRNKNSVWRVKNAGVVKLVLEENNQLTHMERATKHVQFEIINFATKFNLFAKRIGFFYVSFFIYLG